MAACMVPRMLDEPRTPSNSSSGFAQVLALAGLAIVGAILSMALVQANRTSQSLGLFERYLTADLAIASATRLLLAAIEDPADDLEQRVGIGASAYRLEGDEPVWLAIEGESGKLDVLRSDTAIMARYLERSGLSPAAARSVLSALADARREDDAPAALDAVSVALARVGKAGQVDQDFTVLSRSAGVDPSLAGERVLRAIPDLADAEVARILRARVNLEPSSDVESQYFNSGRPVFTIVATVRWNETERTAKRVPFEITTGGKAQVLSGFR